LKLYCATVEWQGLVEFGRKYNEKSFADWPDANAIPYGRDLLLLSIAGKLATTLGVGCLAIANDYESLQRREFNLFGRIAVRTELASNYAYRFLKLFLNTFFPSGLKLIYPIAHLSKYAIARQLVENFSDVEVNQLSSCEWGNWCGRCKKCLTYCLLFTEYPGVKINFVEDPFDYLKNNILAINSISGNLHIWENIFS